MMDPSESQSPPALFGPSDPPPGAPPTGKPALVIVIQSGLTVALGLVMLTVGLVVGFLLRPALMPEAAALPPITVIAQIPTQKAVPTEPLKLTATADKTASVVGTVTLPTTPTPDRSAQLAQLLKVVLAQSRHFKGAEDAPVVVVEFSDFQ
jgi:hypothetical protein